MPRARMLSRSISTSVSIESMSEWAQLLFDRIVIWSDDYGRIEGDPRVLKGTVKPLSLRAPSDFAEAVAEMVKVGAIAAYVAGGRILLHVVRNDEHQRVSKKTPSRYPDPAEFVGMDSTGYMSAVVNGVPRENSGNLGDSRPREEKRREEKRREENTPCSPPQAGDANPLDSKVAGERNEPVAAGEPESKRARKKTAAHITPEWQPSAEWISWLEAECPAVDVARVVPEFRDFWIGEGKPKADWNATFANRVRAIDADISSGNRRAIAAFGRRENRATVDPEPLVMSRRDRVYDLAIREVWDWVIANGDPDSSAAVRKKFNLTFRHEIEPDDHPDRWAKWFHLCAEEGINPKQRKSDVRYETGTPAMPTVGEL